MLGNTHRVTARMFKYAAASLFGSKAEETSTVSLASISSKMASNIVAAAPAEAPKKKIEMYSSVSVLMTCIFTHARSAHHVSCDAVLAGVLPVSGASQNLLASQPVGMTALHRLSS